MHRLLVLLLLCIAPLAAAAQVAPDRVARLARGVNLSHWFSQVHTEEGYTYEHLRTHTTEADIDAIAAAAFTHVRLPVDPLHFLEEQDPPRIDPRWFQELDRCIAMITQRDLAVIVDLHSFGPFIDRLEKHDDQIDRVATLWTGMASHLAGSDPSLVFLEVMNEPKLNDAERWQFIQERLHAAIRAAAPEHTIILTGKHFSGARDLAQLRPVADGNVVYNFHFYEPMIFTHQASHWAWWPWKHCTGVPYPSEPENVRQAIADAGHDRSKGLLRDYGNERWNRAKLASIIDVASGWAKRHGVPITCNEFGVFTKSAPPDARLRWLSDSVALFEERGIGWSMWDYQGGFALKDATVDGTAVLDAEVLRALGLPVGVEDGE